MPLQFVFGPSGSGKSHYLYQHIIEESGKTSGAVLYRAGAGAVHNADAERSGRHASQSWNYEY